MSRPLKFIGFSVVCQEVPDEISIAINISDCPYKCRGCHSKFLWEYNGELLLEKLQDIISKYKELVTCVCFMGGDQNEYELIEAFKITKSNNLKTCLYTGNDDIENTNKYLPLLDYVKIGRYDESLGGLNFENTNQRFFVINNGELTDLTNTFIKN